MTDPFINLYSGSPLNRLGWLRPSYQFLNAVIVSPATRWMLFNAGQPLVSTTSSSATGTTNSDSSKQEIAYLTTSDIRPLLGSEPFFGQGQHEGTLCQPQDGSAESESLPHSMESARHRGIPIVFLGLREDSKEGEEDAPALPSSDFKDAQAAVRNLQGTPMFAVDVADVDDDDHTIINALFKSNRQQLRWVEPRSLMPVLGWFDAAVFAQARSMVDWNMRNKFCPACGSRNYSLWGGWKLSCSTLLPWADNAEESRKPCITAKGLHNFTHPRTDPVVITIAVDETGDKVLLGRNKKFPGKFYSALAGFCEPGESFEDSVKREMWEEAGVNVWNVKYHSGQPWPYPANLMVGFYARADSSKPIRTDLDNELQDARWFTRDEVIAILEHPDGSYLTSRDNKQLNRIQDGPRGEHNRGGEALAHSDPNINNKNDHQPKRLEDTSSSGTEASEPPFRVPPKTAIAGVLIRDWAYSRFRFHEKGNL